MAPVPFIDVGVLFIFVLTASLANGFLLSRDVPERTGVDELKPDTHVPGPAPLGQAPPTAPRRRAKRCTCYTYKDKECVYYCHLDIIWINTPERTLPYGMSSYQGSSRGRRSLRVKDGTEDNISRCVCLKSSDSHCRSFCAQRQTEDSHVKRPGAEGSDRL